MEKQSGDTEMSDIALAQQRIRQVAAPAEIGEGIKAQINRAHRLLTKQRQTWTYRRVRAFWYGEAARVDYQEIRDMEAVIALREARRDHARYIAQTERLAAQLAATDPAFHSQEIERLRGLARGVDCAGNKGDNQ